MCSSAGWCEQAPVRVSGQSCWHHPQSRPRDQAQNHEDGQRKGDTPLAGSSSSSFRQRSMADTVTVGSRHSEVTSSTLCARIYNAAALLAEGDLHMDVLIECECMQQELLPRPHRLFRLSNAFEEAKIEHCCTSECTSSAVVAWLLQ